MQIYFGKATKEDVQCTGTDGLFISQDSEAFFYYGIDYGTMGTDEVTVYDSAGRRVPLNTDSVESLINALNHVQIYIQRVKDAEKLTNNVLNPHFSISV